MPAGHETPLCDGRVGRVAREVHDQVCGRVGEERVEVRVGGRVVGVCDSSSAVTVAVADGRQAERGLRQSCGVLLGDGPRTDECAVHDHAREVRHI